MPPRAVRRRPEDKRDGSSDRKSKMRPPSIDRGRASHPCVPVKGSCRDSLDAIDATVTKKFLLTASVDLARPLGLPLAGLHVAVEGHAAGVVRHLDPALRQARGGRLGERLLPQLAFALWAWSSEG